MHVFSPRNDFAASFVAERERLFVDVYRARSLEDQAVAVAHAGGEDLE